MSLSYCPDCGASLQKQNATYYECVNKHPYYNNPRATVAVIFLKDGQALFSKRGIEPNKGKYDFPGGFLEYDEDPYDACIREISEETGVSIQREDLKLLTAYSEEYLPEISVTDLIFVITKWGGKFVATDDSAALEWKPLSFISDDQFVPFYKDLAVRLSDHLAESNL